MNWMLLALFVGVLMQCADCDRMRSCNLPDYKDCSMYRNYNDNNSFSNPANGAKFCKDGKYYSALQQVL